LSVSIATSVISMAVLLSCAASHWPGKTNGCFENYLVWVDCYCERPRGNPGEAWFAQPANSWSNMGFIAVSLFIAWCSDTKSFPSPGFWNNDDARRGSEEKHNYMLENFHFQASYVAAVAFLGPGSMFMHASLTNWGGVVDVFSMNLYALWAFVYSITRMFYPNRAVMVGASIIYIFAIILLIGIFTKFSEIATDLFSVLLASAILFDVLWRLWNWHKKSGIRTQYKFFISAFLMLCAAIAIWMPSRSGGSFCFPESAFQGHGVWHVLTAISTGLYYFYICSEMTGQ
ncbi:unnamed protein product, partial [Heterosigma akashiwo]